MTRGALSRSNGTARVGLERTTSQDPYLNYCLWDYPPATAGEGKLRAVNLLRHSFAIAGCSQQSYRFVEAIQRTIGPFRTVFGIKWTNERLCWEYYFYDYRRQMREVSIDHVLDVLMSFRRCNGLPSHEAIPYFMFSIDVDDELLIGKRDLELIHVYVGTPGSSVSSGIAYGIGRNGLRMENLYSFFDAKTHRDDAEQKVRCSPFAGANGLAHDDVLWPEVSECRTICIANKVDHDCIYFSGVRVDQLLAFLRRLRYPKDIVHMVESNEGELDHLLYDVGVDYRFEHGKQVILRSAYYGVF